MKIKLNRIISFHPFNNGFASLELSVTNSLTLKENEDIYISVVFSIRNSNDFSSHIAKGLYNKAFIYILYIYINCLLFYI